MASISLSVSHKPNPALDEAIVAAVERFADELVALDDEVYVSGQVFTTATGTHGITRAGKPKVVPASLDGPPPTE